MGINVKNLMLSSAVLLAIGATSAMAADLPAKAYTKAPPVVAAFDPWDVAFGAGITNNYVFRGVTQSNREASVTAYFEPRYNVTKDLQLYAGVAGNSISFTNRAAAEVDVYAGIRPTFGPVTFDFGVWGYLYPGGQCIDGNAGGVAAGLCPAGAAFLPNGNFMKADVSFYEFYGKVNYTFNDNFSLGANVFYTPNFLNSGADGTYASIVGKVTAPTAWFGASGVGAYLSGEFGRQWLGTSDAFYGNVKYADYNTWNVGFGFTYKVFTLDFRYSDTDLTPADCNLFTSDFTATAAGSKWCGAAGIVKLSADLTAMTNLK
jgi:hypothetical protein